ncbi:hypothetical protein TNCV_3504491 [Trichonephila clavipes]|uniref:Uncharacterized protein n=1 Tax=Trichonephila clavipes TaxID=2585209 RepID=A0A8X6V7V5_TRICX|nr:hypothetical protein TNCV_3504491 [Trichonephila clavipes]
MRAYDSKEVENEEVDRKHLLKADLIRDGLNFATSMEQQSSIEHALKLLLVYTLVKSVDTQCPPTGMMEKLGKEIASSGVVLVTWFGITRSVTNSFVTSSIHVLLLILLGGRRRRFERTLFPVHPLSLAPSPHAIHLKRVEESEDATGFNLVSPEGCVWGHLSKQGETELKQNPINSNQYHRTSSQDLRETSGGIFSNNYSRGLRITGSANHDSRISGDSLHRSHDIQGIMVMSSRVMNSRPVAVEDLPCRGADAR